MLTAKTKMTDDQKNELERLSYQVVKKMHQAQTRKNCFRMLKQYFPDSIYLLRKFGFKRFYNFWYTKFFIVDEGGEFDLNYKKIHSDPLSVKEPDKIELEITTVCNKKCVLCSHTYWEYKQRQMTFGEFKNLIDSSSGLKWINFAGIGANFLNKDYVKMLEYVSKKNLNVNAVDEFEFLTEEHARKMVELGLNSLYVSFDATNKETYEKMKKGCNFDQFMANMKTLLRVKEEMKSPFPVLHFRFIIHRDNYQQMSEYIDLVNSLKPRGTRARVEFIGVIVFEQNKEYAMAIEDVPFELKKEVYQKALDYGINLYFSHASATKPNINTCIRWTEPFILVSGEVLPCCSILLQSERDFLAKYNFGNIYEKNFYDIWDSEHYKNFRQTVVNPNAPVPMICKHCCSHCHDERAEKYGYYDNSQ